MNFATAIVTAYKLHECRRIARILIPVTAYDSQMKYYGASIEGVARDKNLPILDAATTIAMKVKDEDPKLSVLVLAAAVELMERMEAANEPAR